MISVESPFVWLFVFGSGYLAFLVYWARIAARQAPNAVNFLNPLRSSAPFAAAMAIGIAGFAPFLAMNFAEGVASSGFGYGAIALGGILIPLTGIFLFKRMWAIAVHFQAPSQANFLEELYSSKTLVVLTAALALLFAVALGGRLIAQFSVLFHNLSGGVFDPFFSLVIIAFVVMVHTVIGGVRGTLYVAFVQGVLGIATLLGLLVFTLVLSGGFDALLSAIGELQKGRVDNSALFTVSGVIQFTRGAGFEPPVGSSWTAVMVFSSAIAFMGLQASPVFYQFATASRSDRVFGPGLIWVSSAVFGGLVLGLALIMGAYGLTTGSFNVLQNVALQLSSVSPWFAAAMYFGLFSVVYALVSGSHLAAANILVCDVYRRNFHKGMSDNMAVVAVRIVIVVLIVMSVLLSVTAPVFIAQLAALCLPLSLQLLPVMVGACYRIGITQSAAPVGAVVGFVCVLLTETFGINALGLFGLDVPWGQWPWTIHSAGWGIFFNVLTVTVISLITRMREQGAVWNDLGNFIGTNFPSAPLSRSIVSTAWSVALAWFLLSIGPGLIIGNTAFVRETETGVINMLGFPSLVIWLLIAWVSGVGMNWFFAYRMQLTSPVPTAIDGGMQPARVSNYRDGMDAGKLARTFWIILSIGGVFTTLAWIFGR